MSKSLTSHDSAATTPDLLLVIFIHGFKGTDETFGEFPKRLQHVLSETVDNVHVESILFPAYEVSFQSLATAFGLA